MFRWVMSLAKAHTSHKQRNWEPDTSLTPSFSLYHTTVFLFTFITGINVSDLTFALAKSLKKDGKHGVRHQEYFKVLSR